MMNKKIVIIALLIVVVVATVITARRVASKPAPPSWVLDQKVQKIDFKSLELVTESLSDWSGKYAPDASGRFKNPKTGEYTVVDTMICKSCGERIPLPPFVETQEMKANPLLEHEARRQGMTDYKCPKCGKPAFSSGAGGVLPGGAKTAPAPALK